MQDHRLFRESVLVTLGFVGILWVIKSWEYATAADLSFLGIYPRTIKGSIGILTSPFIHGDIQHLVSNTFPLVILGTGLFFFYRRIALEVFIIIYVSTGLWVWAIARPAFHIGASGLVYGLAAFLFFIGLLRKDARSLAVSMVVVFLYHGLFAGVFPLSAGISWESHLLGACSGIMCAFYYRLRGGLAGERPLTDEQEETVNREIRKEWQVVYKSDDSGSDTNAEENEKQTSGDSVNIPGSLFITFSNMSDNGNKKNDSPVKKRDEKKEEDDDLISLN